METDPEVIELLTTAFLLHGREAFYMNATEEDTVSRLYSSINYFKSDFYKHGLLHPIGVSYVKLTDKAIKLIEEKALG